MVGEKVFTTITIDGQKVPLRPEFCKELLKLQNKHVELIQIHTENTDALSPLMAEKVRNELLFV